MMNDRARRNRWGLVTLCALLAAGIPAAAAPAGFQDYPGGLQVLTEQWPPPQHFKSEYDQPSVVRYMLNLSWDRSSDDLCARLKDDLGKPNAVIKGQTLYDITCSMGSSDKTALRIKDDLQNGRVELEYFVPGNYLEFTSTQPTAAGKWADPRFSVAYDLDLLIKLAVNGPPGLTVASATAQVNNAKLDSHGVIADVVVDFVNIVKATVGLDLKSMAERAIEAKKTSFTGLLQQQIAPVNGILKGYADQGYTSMYGKLDSGKLRLFLVGKTFKVPTSGPGVIAGAIRWRAADGHPQNAMAGCHTLRILALASAGYAAPGQFAPPSVPVGTVEVGPVPGQLGDRYECTYKIANLPLGVPMNVQVGPAGSWVSATNASVIPRAQPSGWTGTITLHEGAKGVALGPQPSGGSPGTTIAPSVLGGGGGAKVRNNPSGTMSVSGIDFDLILQQAPR